MRDIWINPDQENNAKLTDILAHRWEKKHYLVNDYYL